MCLYIHPPLLWMTLRLNVKKKKKKKRDQPNVFKLMRQKLFEM